MDKEKLLCTLQEQLEPEDLKLTRAAIRDLYDRLHDVEGRKQNWQWTAENVRAKLSAAQAEKDKLLQQMQQELSILQSNEVAANADSGEQGASGMEDQQEWRQRALDLRIQLAECHAGSEELKKQLLLFRIEKSSTAEKGSSTQHTSHLQCSLSEEMTSAEAEDLKVVKEQDDEINQKKQNDKTKHKEQNDKTNAGVEAYLTEALRDSPVYVAHLDKNLRYTFVYNQPYGLKAEDMIGKCLTEVIPADYSGILENIRVKQEVLETGRTVKRECEMMIPGVGPMTWAMTCVPKRNANGEIIGVCMGAMDITEQVLVRAAMNRSQAEMAARQIAEGELQKSVHMSVEALQAKTNFVAVMSHEIRTPLNGVLGLAEILAQTPLNSEQAELVQKMQESGAVLLTLINDILSLSKAESGSLELESEAYQPHLVAKEVLGTMKAGAFAKNVELRAELDSNVPFEVVGDPVRLKQILSNLLENAIKFTENGWVALRMSLAPASSTSFSRATTRRCLARADAHLDPSLLLHSGWNPRKSVPFGDTSTFPVGTSGQLQRAGSNHGLLTSAKVVSGRPSGDGCGTGYLRKLAEAAGRKKHARVAKAGVERNLLAQGPARSHTGQLAHAGSASKEWMALGERSGGERAPPKTGEGSPTEGEELWLHFEIVDTGIGIPKWAFRTLFDKFTQVNAGTKRPSGGTGLGLAIVKRLVELLGGEINVQSEEGEGSIFSFDICCRQAVPPQTQLCEAMSSKGCSAQERVHPPLSTLQPSNFKLAGRFDEVGETINSTCSEQNQDDPSGPGAEAATETVTAVDHGREKGLSSAGAAEQCAGKTEGQALVWDKGENKDGSTEGTRDTSTEATGKKRLFDLRGGSLACKEQPVSGPVAKNVSVEKRPRDEEEDVVEPPSLRRKLSSKSSIISSEPKKESRVLIVDDNHVNQLVAASMLKKLGETADVAKDGTEAIRCMQRKAYDLVLMDVCMPVMDGLEASRIIREYEETGVWVDGDAGSPALSPDEGLAFGLRSLTKAGGGSGAATDCPLGLESCSGESCSEKGKSATTKGSDALPLEPYEACPKETRSTRKRAICDSRRRPRVPIVALTANAFSDDVERCLHSGMDSFLAKPVNFQKLKSVVDCFLINR